MNCATERCDDPNCGPCSLYQRYPELRKYDKQQAKLKKERARTAKDRTTKNAARDGSVDLLAQAERSTRSRKRKRSEADGAVIVSLESEGTC